MGQKPLGKGVQRLASRLGGAIDQAVLSALSHRFKERPSARARGTDASIDRRALLSEAIAFYRQPALLEAGGFFPEPPAARPVEVRRGSLPNGGSLVDLKWQSGFEPFWELARAEYMSHEPNRFSYVRMLRHAEPAPTLVYLHGYRGGQFVVEERFFPTRWLYSLGLNVALFTLPFHGRRGGAAAPVWPSANLGRANEGFAQAIFDLRAFLAYLREVGGDRPIVLAGMSLGGYTSALAATIPLGSAAPSLGLVTLMIPVASFPDLMWATARYPASAPGPSAKGSPSRWCARRWSCTRRSRAVRSSSRIRCWC